MKLPKSSLIWASGTNIYIAPTFIAAELLRAEGFDDVRYIEAQGGFTAAQMIGRGEIDFGMTLGASLVANLDAGAPLAVIGGVHSGCYELFAREHIHTIADMKGKSIGIQTLSSSAHLYLSIMAAHVGLNPQRDINWVTSRTESASEPMELYAAGETDAFLAFPPEPQALRARGIERVIIKTATDRPWSQYFCCMLAGNREFVSAHPGATKRVLRAVLKAADLCAPEPERAARQLVDGGVTPRLLRSADDDRGRLRQVARVRRRGHDPLLRASVARSGHDHLQPQADHRRGHRLALPERDQARTEGVIQTGSARHGNTSLRT
jgi:NitT/TauT family transport system substrate-binding protein